MKRNLLPRVFTRLRDTAGTNMIEAAIITPLLLISSFAIMDFGVLLYVHLALANGASQATRFGVTGNAMPGLSREASIKAAFREATPTLTLDDSAFHFSHMSGAGGAWSAGIGAPGEVDKVTVDYTYQIITPFLKPLFPGGYMHFQVESAMKNETAFTQ